MLTATEAAHLKERFELAEQLLLGRDSMYEPQDLPGREGRAIKAIDHVLQVTGIEAVLAGGWAVWRHGYEGRLTADIDVALPADQLEEFLKVASFSGFELLPRQPGRWPKLRHKESGLKVDTLPEGSRPGTSARPAPTTIPHPAAMGAKAGRLRYINLASLIELKLAAGRAQDEADVVKLIQTNEAQLEKIRKHLADVHADYVQAFDRLVQRAREQEDK